MVAYKVDWGDAEPTVVSGVEMRDRPNEKNPHSLYHLYDYWDLLEKNSKGQGSIYCSNKCKDEGYCSEYNGPYCAVQPKVLIKDNWGWYNNGTNRNDGGRADVFKKANGSDAWVVVKEK